MTPFEALVVALKTYSRTSEIEDIIMITPNTAYHYARHVINGKLPDKMHNMMILHAIKDPDDWCVKRYFKSVNH
jgi:hypothetical protein